MKNYEPISDERGQRGQRGEPDLRPIGIRTSIGHRQCERSIVTVGRANERKEERGDRETVPQVAMKLISEFSAPNALPSCAIPKRVTGLSELVREAEREKQRGTDLDHESFDHPVEDQIVIITISCMGLQEAGWGSEQKEAGQVSVRGQGRGGAV
jgi:hypothetical protein